MGVSDFSGYVTKNDLRCSDGRTIRAGAFKHADGARVPLVWMHQHKEVDNILGHVMLEVRHDGVYGHGYFNKTPAADSARQLVEHGDIVAMSIYANELKESKGNVTHGTLREVSLVLSGANPGALIENINLSHGDGDDEILDDEAVIHTGLALEHEDSDDEPDDEDSKSDDESDDEDLEHADNDKSVQDVVDSMDEDQKNALYYLVAQAIGDTPADSVAQDATNSQEADMTRNVFENGATATGPSLSHDQFKTIVQDAQKTGSFKDSFLAHAVEYGIENIDLLFPDAKALTNTPEWIGRRTEWVSTVINGARKNPFSRIKSLSADINHEEARARGYIKATLKKEEWFGLAKRETTPTTIYKKQKLDRDDIIDITDLDVVAWLKSEMRLMLDEEIGRAILIGDGREVDSEDKINEERIRPIAYDDDFYTHKVIVPSQVSGDALVEAILRARPKYRGSGNPTMFCTEDLLTDLILVKDRMGRRLYPTQAELQSALRVSNIVTVEVMENQTINGGDLLCVLVNMSDYTMGADRGGAISMFDDFDIDYNQYKYLIETRMSGALTKFKSAMAFQRGGGILVASVAPTFNASTGVVTIPSITGVVWKNRDTGAVAPAGARPALAAGESVEYVAEAATGYYFAHNTDNDFEFTRNA